MADRMPRAPKQYCLGGCRRLVERGRCKDCSRKQEQERGSANDRLYDYRWQRYSRERLKQHRLCVDPDKRHPDQVVLATCTDHIVPHKGDTRLFWDESNHQSLCDGCHSFKTVMEDGGFGKAVTHSGEGDRGVENISRFVF
jgi:5-methylcytosine-specific restriction protein A